MIFRPRKTSETDKLANGIYVLQIDERIIVHRVQRGVKQNIRLNCDNPAFNDEFFEN